MKTWFDRNAWWMNCILIILGFIFIVGLVTGAVHVSVGKHYTWEDVMDAKSDVYHEVFEACRSNK